MHLALLQCDGRHEGALCFTSVWSTVRPSAVRADLAWSPDATPIGAYVTAGEMF
jgi:hypothetical protein